MSPLQTRYAIRSVEYSDIEKLFLMIRELASYEGAEEEVLSTPECLAEALFAPAPKIFARIALSGDEPIACLVWYEIFSTFRGQTRAYIEDLYVSQAHRGKGIGKALIADLAKHCATIGYVGLRWSVLRENGPSIQFYQAIGASITSSRLRCSLEGELFMMLANKAVPVAPSGANA